uniref:Uncharacterized protein n=1 Tax=Arundo donax TaxID=35708 RepID=A0A0A9HIP0_ARUDO
MVIIPPMNIHHMSASIQKKMWKEQPNFTIHMEKVHVKGIITIAVCIVWMLIIL